MKRLVAVLFAAGCGMGAAVVPAGREATPGPLVIAHRGASGERPEHTLEAYRLAIEQGADFVEPDLVATKDGVLVCRHESEISGTTDVASRPEFASRRATRTVDGATVTGWFAEDFTLAEIRGLRARERLPHLRGTAFDGRFGVPTVDEVLALVAEANARPDRRGRRVGVYPETKHPSHFASLGLALEPRLLEALRRHGLDGPGAPVFIQSFEVGSLRRLASRTRVPLVQLFATEGRPDMLRPEGLRDVATYAAAIGVHTSLVVPRDGRGRSLPPTSLVRDAHAAGLLVHVWTLRAENEFLPTELRRGTDAAAHGDMEAQATLFLRAGVDGFFTDHPRLGVGARDAFRR